jgi:hypothetical protein
MKHLLEDNINSSSLLKISMQVKPATPQFLLIGHPFVAATLQARSPQLTLSWIPADPLCSMSYGCLSTLST